MYIYIYIERERERYSVIPLQWLRADPGGLSLASQGQAIDGELDLLVFADAGRG